MFPLGLAGLECRVPTRRALLMWLLSRATLLLSSPLGRNKSHPPAPSGAEVCLLHVTVLWGEGVEADECVTIAVSQMAPSMNAGFIRSIVVTSLRPLIRMVTVI
ncbi:hypothetical protein ISCGN_007218 [Ixodes scapularis]